MFDDEKNEIECTRTVKKWQKKNILGEEKQNHWLRRRCFISYYEFQKNCWVGVSNLLEDSMIRALDSIDFEDRDR